MDSDLQFNRMLFDLEPKFPNGFSYSTDFITTEEEILLVDQIEKVALKPLIFQGFEAKRKVESFGYDYNFSNRSISKGQEIPAGFNFLLKKLSTHTQIPITAFAELLLTEYPVGSVINWHRDAPPFDIVIGISLLSDCMFKLRPYDKKLQTRNNTLSFPVKRRSLYIMKDESRADWEHSIAPVKEKRFSITVRTLR